MVSTRAVVERRQQIGMLRALGFQREMVSWSFMIESSVVALLGIGLGTVLALIPAYHMINDMAKEMPTITVPGALVVHRPGGGPGLRHGLAGHLAAGPAGLPRDAGGGAAV